VENPQYRRRFHCGARLRGRLDEDGQEKGEQKQGPHHRILTIAFSTIAFSLLAKCE
jgi:hypothetical protein